ncbi:MAG TPA: isoprenyl synthetase [Microscillaceae bacterium]|jgi:geranylgeranyl diphosphate synthase type II|nr:isoprenyl synthetase [Microscillaceae bacterium]
MHTIQTLKDQIEATIEALQFPSHPVELYDPIRYTMALGGKRIRPLLTLVGYGLYANEVATALKPAVAVEMFHNFTLLHDDIMDQAPLRRGKPTVHHQWNTNIAILSGDVMLVNAYELFDEVPNQHYKQVIQHFNRCAAEVCEGQQWDMNFETLPQVTESQYIEMIRLKTAVLLGFALALGGILGGASAEDITLLRNFGENIGIGFQLKDDLLDVYGEADKFGKQVGGDILANKKTFLLIKALEMATGDTATKLQHWLSQKQFDPQEKVRAIKEIYNNLGIETLTKQKIQSFFDIAFTQFDRIHVSDERKKPLKQLMQDLIEREN